MANTTPTPALVEPPSVSRGRRGATLPDEFVNAVADLLRNADKGSFASTGETYADQSHARKAAEILRRELVRVEFVNDKSHLSTRIWETDGKWNAAVALKPE